jgi:hypothetical protein
VQVHQPQGRQPGPVAVADADRRVHHLVVEVEHLQRVLDHQLDIGMPGDERRQPGNEPGRGKQRRDAEAQPGPRVDTGKRFAGAEQIGEGSAGRLGQRPAGRRHLHRAVRAREQRGADRTLQVADAVADGGRREVQRARRRLEALQAHCSVERLQRQEQGRPQLGRSRR